MEQKINEIEFNDLVQNTLNHEYLLGLLKDRTYASGGQKIQYDLVDVQNLTFVEINIGFSTNKRPEIVQHVKSLSTHALRIVQTGKIRFILVFGSPISENDRSYITKELKSDSRIEYTVLDLENVLSLATNHNIKYSDIFLKILGDFSSDMNESKKAINEDEIQNDSFSVEMTSEEMRESLRTEREASAIHELTESKNSFWWLNTDEVNWPIEEALEGELYFYPKSTILKSKTMRVRNSFYSISLNDIVLTCQGTPNKKLTGLYQSVKSDNNDVLAFRFVQSLATQITWEELMNLPIFQESVIKKMSTSGSVNKLTTELFIDLIKLTDNLFNVVENIHRIKNSFLDNKSNINPSKIASLNSDSIEGKDYFKIDPDITAFAKVIASNSFKPPLAIALFGKWGMGKSFFMNKLKEKIIEYSKEQEFIDEPIYCNGVAHIHFNAWSYMDANLWASIVSQIFEGLYEFLSKHSNSDDEKEAIEKILSEKLLIIKGDRESLIELKNSIAAEISKLEIEQTTLKGELENGINEIQNQTLEEILQPIINDYNVKEKVDQALENNQALKSFNSELKKIVPLKYRENPELAIEQIKSVPTFIRELIRDKLLLKWLLLGLIITIFVLVAPILIPTLTEYVSKSVTFVAQLGLSVIAILSPIIVGFKSVYDKIQPILGELWSVKKEYDQQIESAKFSYLQKREAIEFSLDYKTQELQITNDKISKLETELRSLESKLENGLSTQTLYSFIEKRASANEYKKHLGIISTIRSDFKVLSDLFTDSSSELFNEEIFKDYTTHKLQRIILYIDDLDRCPEDRVIEVLEAVNLLMAFPLFVVVVGVDPRWVNNALQKKYHLQFGETTKNGYEQINVSDYLEKIFQVPFHLKQAEDSDVKNMLKELTKEAVKTENNLKKTKLELIDKDSFQMGEIQMGEIQLSMGGTTIDNQYHLQNEPLIMDHFLSLRPQEVELMQDFSEIIGNNPRAIKRFVNIYQIVRAHEGLTIESEVDDKEFLAIMFLLGLSIGPYKPLFEEFGQYIEASNTNMSKFLIESFDKEKMKFPDLLKSLDSKIRKMQNAKELIRIMTPEFKKHNQFIKRFTFSY